jgi:hypothetical protein
MIGIAILVVVVVGFVLWDRRTPASPAPDMRLVWVGAVLAAIGLVASLLAWWLIVPVIMLIVGATLIVIGRHRQRAPRGTVA